MLAMPQSAAVCWGRDLCQLYNDRYARYLGSRHPHALGRPLLETWKELSDTLKPAIQYLFEDGAALEYMDHELHLAGHGDDPAITWVTGGWTPLRDSQGRIQGFLSTTIDTTNHVLALRALRQSEERQAYLLKLSDALRPLADPQVIQREASRVLRAQLKAHRVAYFEVEGNGQSVVARGEDHRSGEQSFLGIRFKFSDFEPNAPELLLRGSTQWRDTIDSETSLSDRQRAAYARVGIRSWMFTSLVKDGRPVACLGAFFDEDHKWREEERLLIEETAERTWAAVERHRALAGREAALAALSHQSRFLEATLSSVPALVYAFDKAHRLVYSNAAMQTFFGKTADELRGKTLADMQVPRELQSRLERYMDHIFATGETVEDQVYYASPSGNSGYFQFTWGPMRASDDSVKWVVCASLDTTERRRLEERQRLLVNELNHRVKNTLATVQSMAAQTLRGAHDMNAAQEIFDSRLVALSKAHDILTQRSWEGASLRRIVDNVAPHSGQAVERFEIEGPDLQVSPKYALALALALHELCTNAIKYGALSNAEGKVRIAWAVIEDSDGEQLRINWQESGGPPVQPPQRRGFGSRLLGRGLRHDLGGSVQIEYRTSGVECTIMAPWSAHSQATPRP